MSQALQPVKSAPMVHWSAEQVQVIKQVLSSGLTDDELRLFASVCQRVKLDPFSRQIYAIKRGGKLCIQTSIDGYRTLAERSGHYAGQDGPYWCDESGEWKDVWLSSKPPVACKVGVYRSNWAKPIYAVARLEAYKQDSNSLWRSMPDVMLAKCAESLALRKAFPQQMQGVYTREEMEQADNEQEVVEGSVVVTEQPQEHMPTPGEECAALAHQLELSEKEYRGIVGSYKFNGKINWQNVKSALETKIAEASLTVEAEPVQEEIAS